MTNFSKKLYGSAFVNQYVAMVTGQKKHHRPHSYIRGGENYTYIAGSIALPSLEFPGFLVTAGTDYKTNDIICINEFESDVEHELIDEAKRLQEEYGQGVIQTWYGNPENLMALVNEEDLRVTHPVDYNQTDAFQLYVARIKTALREGHKSLYLKNCERLINHILSFVKEKSAKKFNNPAIYAIGSLVHTIVTLRPWERANTKFDIIPTLHDEYTEYASKVASKHIEKQLWGAA